MFNRKLLLATAIASAAASLPTFAQDNDDASSRLETMIVTASLTAKTTQTAPAFTSVITGDDILATPITALPEILGQTAGVNDYSDASGRDSLRLRGLDGQYTLILVNGKRVSSSSALWRGGDFDLSSVPLSSIQQVEIVRGPMSSLYGADAMGGVINIITKAPEDEWSGQVNGEYRSVLTGEGGTQARLGAAAQGRLNEQLALSVALDTLSRDAWYIDGEEEGVNSPKLEEKEATNVAATLTWNLADNQKLDFDLGVNQDNRPYDTFYAAGDSKDYREQEISRNTLGVSYLGEWGWGNTSLQLQREDASIDDFNSRYDEPQNRELTEENLSLKGYSNFAAGKYNALTVGFDYRQQTVGDDVSYAQTGEVSITDKALFMQDEISLGERVTLTLGGRMDDNEFFGSHFTPRAYVVVELTDSIAVKGGYAEAFKAPGAYQLSSEYSIVSCGGSCFLSGDEDLEPETSANIEAGISIAKSHWDLSLVYFQNDVDDMISALYDADTNSRYWSNVDKVKTKGFEIEGALAITDAVSLSGNLTKLDTENVGSGDKLENRPEIQANVSLNWKILDTLSSSLSANHIGEQEIYVWPDYQTLPAYTRYDLGLSSPLSSSFTLRAGIKNLTDVQTQEEDANFNTFELGRNVYLSATYSF